MVIKKKAKPKTEVIKPNQIKSNQTKPKQDKNHGKIRQLCDQSFHSDTSELSPLILEVVTMMVPETMIY